MRGVARGVERSHDKASRFDKAGHVERKKRDMVSSVEQRVVKMMSPRPLIEAPCCGEQSWAQS